jgi:hypothetical protein
MLLFYLAYGATFCYTLFVLVYSGRVEVMTTQYKVDKVEAPSVVVCPFWASTETLVPAGLKDTEILHVTKYGIDGPERLMVEARTCRYDRTCVCGDLWPLGKGSEPVWFQDHVSRDTKNIGTTGEKSEAEMVFRERIEVMTNATDGSGDRTLKVGFYDSVDPAPQFFYLGQGGYGLGSLELATWTVSDFTFEGLYETVMGNVTAMVRPRHIFRYTSQEVAEERSAVLPNQSIFSYEMKNFFVEDTVSAETAFSPYTLAYLIMLIVIRSAVITIFISTVFPEYDPHKDDVKHREMSGAASSLARYCGCCCFSNCFGRGEPSETSRLLPS